MTRFDKFFVINFVHIPKLCFYLFHGYFTRLALRLLLGIQFTEIYFEIKVGGGKHPATKVNVVGYSRNQLYYINGNMLCGVDWKYVKKPSYDKCVELLFIAKEWTHSEEYINTMQVLNYLNSNPSTKALRIKDRHGHQVFDTTVGYSRDQAFVKDLLKMQGRLFMFVFPHLSYSYAYKPRDAEILIEKIPE